MKKTVLVYGLISGLIVASLMVVNSIYCSETGNNIGMVLGYSSMIIAFSLIFVAIKNYRDKFKNGVISFGKAFQIGFLITLIASTMYVLVWQIEYNFFMPDFAEKYGAKILNDLKASGAGHAEIEEKRKEMAEFAIMYKKPLYNILMTYAEILPVGLLVTLVSSLIVKRKVKKAEA